MKWIKNTLKKINEYFFPIYPEYRGDILFNGDDYDVKIISNHKEVLKAHNGKLYIYGTEVIL